MIPVCCCMALSSSYPACVIYSILSIIGQWSCLFFPIQKSSDWIYKETSTLNVQESLMMNLCRYSIVKSLGGYLGMMSGSTEYCDCVLVRHYSTGCTAETGRSWPIRLSTDSSHQGAATAGTSAKSRKRVSFCENILGSAACVYVFTPLTTLALLSILNCREILLA